MLGTSLLLLLNLCEFSRACYYVWDERFRFRVNRRNIILKEPDKHPYHPLNGPQLSVCI